MLSGRRKKDYAAESAANALEAQAASYGEGEDAAVAAAGEPLVASDEAEAEEDEEAETVAA
jgi:hypothetical protein